MTTCADDRLSNNENRHQSCLKERPQIHPTKEESSLFDILVGVCSLSEREVTVRVAGGWVRDKLLNSHSYDIDVSLDTLTGEAFASLVQKYLLSMENEKEGTDNNNKQEKNHAHTCSKVSVIKANPDKSKHLETATMKIDTIEVDFVNLRTAEIYEDNHRIPTSVVFGTPKEDAERRDFTVNSLFYNLHTREVEDWTNQGLDDMDAMIIRTPLDPNVTFTDDPLRVLRAVRFAVRFGFELADDLKRAASSKLVHEALMSKVSRERVGSELEGMLTGKNANPGAALLMIAELGLQDCIFAFPDTSRIDGHINSLCCNERIHKDQADFCKTSSSNMSMVDCSTEGNCENAPFYVFSDVGRQEGWMTSIKAVRLIPHILQAFKDEDDSTLMAEKNMKTHVDLKLLHLGAMMLPFGSLSFLDGKNKEQGIISYITSTSIKFKKTDVTDITAIIDSCAEMKAFLVKLRVDKLQPTRLEIGMVVRKLKGLWFTCLNLAAIADILSDSRASEMDQSLNEFKDLCKIIDHYELDGCWRQRPILDGKAIIKSLDLKNGPMVGKYMNEQIKWMLRHPNGTKEKCIIYLKQKKNESEHATEMHSTMTQLELTSAKRTASQASLGSRP